MNDTLVIDLETKKTFAEVGGEQHIAELGISVAGIYSYTHDAFFALEEHELGKLEEMLEHTGHLIGFNINYFDIPVLKPYLKKVVIDRIAVTDIFKDAEDFLGHRIGLNAVAEATLGESKSGHGLEALEWFREGRVEEVKKYCLDDVRLTRDIYEYGKKFSHILYKSKNDDGIHSIPVSWNNAPKIPILALLESALKNRTRLAVEYVSAENSDGLGYKKTRLIDVYKIKKDEIEAFCHLRQGMRNFRINRILNAEPTSELYAIPQDFQKALF